jgi:hypothetical protein
MSKGEVNGLGLGPDPEAVHDDLDIGVFDLDVGTNPTHTRSIHVTCRLGVGSGLVPMLAVVVLVSAGVPGIEP